MNENVKVICDDCGLEYTIPKWLQEKHVKEGEGFFCSNGCPYHAETGNNPEEY